jgi:GntR family transcriptional regulator / MocR family aminotransferase
MQPPRRSAVLDEQCPGERPLVAQHPGEAGEAAIALDHALPVPPCDAVRGRATPLVPLLDAAGPIYERLFKELRRHIMNGSWRAGTRLPSSRLLAQDLGISRGSASLALEQLVAEGWATSTCRKGVFVAPLKVQSSPGGAARTAERGVEGRSFESLRHAPDLFPMKRWRQHQNEVWRRYPPDELLALDRGLGNPVLRSALARLVLPSRGINATLDEVAITSGAAQATLLAVRACLPAGGSVALESPGNPLLANQLRAHGYRITLLEGENDHAEPLASADLLVCGFGLTATQPRRNQHLLQWAVAGDRWIIEYDGSGLPHEGPLHAPALCAGATYPRQSYVRDFDQLIYPGLNIALLVPAAEALDRVAETRRFIHERRGNHEQLVLADFIEHGGFAAQLRRVSLELRKRRQALLAAFAACPLAHQLQDAGAHLVIKAAPADLQEIWKSLTHAGLEARPVADFDLGQRTSEGLLLPVTGISMASARRLRDSLSDGSAPYGHLQ